MTAQVTFNPYAQSSGNAGLFNTASDGLRQGTAYPDPATRYRLRTGILASTETLPMWGGVGVYANVPGVAGQPNVNLGQVIGRATALTGATALAGFSTFDQAYGMITSPQSPVPLIGTAGQVMWYPMGSLVRLAVACDPALINLRGGPIGGQFWPAPNLVSWDFANQLLVPFEGSAFTISSGTYVSATGVITVNFAAPVTSVSPGDAMILSGLAGTGAVVALQGTWTILSVTSGGSTMTLQGPVAAGAATISAGTATLGSGTNSPLNVSVLEVKAVNCETVVYSAATGFATWSYNGACAVIQL
jgi:hypothetical protein